MTVQKKAAAGGKGAALPIHWAAFLMIDAGSTVCGVSCSEYERLPGRFETAVDAQRAALMAIEGRQDAIGFTTKCMEVAA